MANPVVEVMLPMSIEKLNRISTVWRKIHAAGGTTADVATELGLESPQSVSSQASAVRSALRKGGAEELANKLFPKFSKGPRKGSGNGKINLAELEALL